MTVRNNCKIIVRFNELFKLVVKIDSQTTWKSAGKNLNVNNLNLNGIDACHSAKLLFGPFPVEAALSCQNMDKCTSSQDNS